MQQFYAAKIVRRGYFIYENPPKEKEKKKKLQ